MPISAGTRLDPYELLSALGTGGMAEVSRARDIRLAPDELRPKVPLEKK